MMDYDACFPLMMYTEFDSTALQALLNCLLVNYFDKV